MQSVACRFDLMKPEDIIIQGDFLGPAEIFVDFPQPGSKFLMLPHTGYPFGPS